MPTTTTRCVLLFARPARVEARVKRFDGLAGAETLFARFRDRLLSAAATLPGVDLIVVGPAAEGELASGARTLPQRGASFAERLGNAFVDARALGYEAIVAVPADVPALGARQLAAAFSRLASRDVVLGPSPDGGVYLIGARVPVARLFAGVHWRTPRVFAELSVNAGSAAVLEPLRDVDRRTDLAAVAGEPGLDQELAALVALILAPAPFGPPERPRALLCPALLLPRAPRAPPAPPLPL